jgi:hypothetical protein
MGCVLVWETLMISREQAEAAWAAFAPNRPDIAFSIRKDLDTMEMIGSKLPVELPANDAELVKSWLADSQ